MPSGPFYNFDRAGVDPSEAVVANWWWQGMMGSAKGHYECLSGFIQEDCTADLKKMSVPVLLMNGEADQIVPCTTSGPRADDWYKMVPSRRTRVSHKACRPHTRTLSMRTCWRSSSPDIRHFEEEV